MAAQASPRGTILIVDDDPEFRAFAADTLARAGYDTETATTGEAALEAAAAASPALVLLDICLPGISGYETCRILRSRFGAGLPIAFVSAVRTESYDRVAGLLIGADDYLAKPVAPDELRLRAERLIRHAAPLAALDGSRLTRREREVLGLMADGLAPDEMAERLSLSKKTVATHIDHILRKLGVHSRAQAVALAYRRDLVGERV